MNPLKMNPTLEDPQLQKSMHICYFDNQGIVHTEFVPQGQTVNQFYYCEILERLKKVVHMRPI